MLYFFNSPPHPCTLSLDFIFVPKLSHYCALKPMSPFLCVSGKENLAQFMWLKSYQYQGDKSIH